MKNTIQMVGVKFGSLTVLSMVGERVKARHPKWICECDCGELCERTSPALRSGRNPNCGCLTRLDVQNRNKGLEGLFFGSLKVIERTEKRYRREIVWSCLCECGNRTEASTGSLKSGNVKSCGCHRDSRWSITHGMSGTPTYVSWYSMKTRCTNKKASSWDWYGGIGINYCERWEKFENFLEDMGERPEGTSIDRIDPKKGYYKENCRWADPFVQARNQSRYK